MGGMRYQPQGLARLALNNPLAASIADLWSPALPNKTLVRSEQTVSIGSVVSSVGPGGLAVRGDGASVNSGVRIFSDFDSTVGASGDTTWFIVRRCRDTVNRGYMLAGYDFGASDRAFFAAPDTDSGNIIFDYGNATAGSGRLIGPAYAKDTQLETLVFVGGQTKGREIWRRGVKLASDPNAKSVRARNGHSFAVGPAGNSTPFDDVEVYMFGIANREWTDTEISSWCANPWQLFEELSDEDELALLSAPNSYTLNVTSGAFGLAASAATLRVTRRLAGGNGSFTLTGNAATLRAGRKVAGVTGVITLVGGSAGLVASRKAAAEPGAFAVTGAAASIRAGRALATSPGAFTVAGPGAGLRASRRITGAPTALALTGSDARLSVARRLAAAAGAFTLTGGAAQLVYWPVVEGNVLFTETGQFVLTGSAVGMRVTRRLQVAAGSFALAGAAATIRCARGLAAGPGAFVVAGGTAVLRATRRLSLAPGALDLVGSPAVLAYSSTIEYARAPAGSGYTPQRNEYQARPAQVGGARPPATEKAYR
jgi:hypothetical protein